MFGLCTVRTLSRRIPNNFVTSGIQQISATTFKAKSNEMGSSVTNFWKLRVAKSEWTCQNSNRRYCDWLKLYGGSYEATESKPIQQNERDNTIYAEKFNDLWKNSKENARSEGKLYPHASAGNISNQNEVTDDYYEKYCEIFKDDRTDDDTRRYDEDYDKIFRPLSNLEGDRKVASLMNLSEFKKVVNTEKNASLTHTDKDGRATMVDVSDKPDSRRTAVAVATIHLGEEAFNLVRENKMKKGDVLSVSQIAGIMAAKNTSSLIPLCHNIPLNKVGVELTLDETDFSVKVKGSATTTGKTGVEMEALMAVNVAALTVYDMCKAVTHDIVITDVKLLEKTGGTRGEFFRNSG
ncbi:uncharacterized protein LOC141903575 [Tubulanus polymorphus]|uniref:uncharacterized protein LOC141903575 n=1 Tax=Tubulanus polymorphus TaxID=672921 RepID=UPI003DA26C74